MGYIINKKDYGVAYTDKLLKEGEFVAACAPIYKKDSFTLRMLIREDWLTYKIIRICILYYIKFNLYFQMCKIYKTSY